MSNYTRKHPLAEKGQVIEITARKCTEKQQPLIQVGKAYIVEGRFQLEDGSWTFLVAHPKRKRATLRVSDKRFDWQILTPEVIAKREMVKVEAEQDRILQEDFTLDEQVQIAFIPLVIENLIWIYADKCIAYAVENRMDVLKKLTRAARHVKDEYERFQRQSLDNKHIENERENARKFIAHCGNDFTIMYYTINGEYKRTNPDFPHDKLATNAIIGMLLIRYLDAWNKKIDGIIADKLGKGKNSVRTPEMDKLYAVLDAYAGNLGAFNFNKPDISMCMTILNRRLNGMHFEVIHDD